MRILLTGALGFTGQHFSKAAVKAGHEVLPLSADITDPSALALEVKMLRPDTVVHLAGISFVGHKNPRSFYDVNVIGCTNLLDALCALPHPPKSILLASSANVYGNCSQAPISENHAVAPINHYAMSKLAMEYMARTYLGKLCLFFVRPFNYTGPGQNESFVIPKMVAHFAHRAPVIELGNLDVEREINDVEFVCQAYLRLLPKAERGGVYNVCSGNPVALQRVLALLAKISNHHLEISVNPAFSRLNEVHRLSGNPEKLFHLIGNIEMPKLEDILLRMLENTATVQNIAAKN